MFVNRKMKLCKCNKCGHEWLPTAKHILPRICPNCKTATWNDGKQCKKNTTGDIKKGA
jgi:hypothetical protein